MSIPFIDLAAQQSRLKEGLDRRIGEVLAHGQYVMGPEVRAFESEMAAFCGASHVLGCGNGTDALALPLMAWGLRPGDAVFCPSFTFCATAEVIPWLGAAPVFVDIDPTTYCMDPDALEAAIQRIAARGEHRPRAVIAVDLFGQSADYSRIRQICDAHGLLLIADSAQGFGTTLDGHHPVHWAHVATASFFPAKPLGCYGDGGAVMTDDESLAQLLDSLRVHGKAVAVDLQNQELDYDPKYLNMRIGMNSRLDTLQAAVLLEKLSVFADEIDARQRVADRYRDGLDGSGFTAPHVPGNIQSVWAQYTVEHGRRDAVRASLQADGVPTAVYYPVPMHVNPGYGRWSGLGGPLPATEAAAARVFSLPMHPYLEPATQDRIIDALRRADADAG